MTRLRPGLAVAAALLLAACGVQPDAAPRDLPDEERTLAVSGTSGSDASGAERVYLVAPGEERLLRSVPRDATSIEDLISILFLGPNDAESEAQYSSVIPPTTELISARLRGQILVLDVSDDFTELTGSSLSQAIAQIVYTAAEVEGIEAVQLLVDGDRLSWPTPSGETTTEPLRIYDYPNVVQTAQPAYPAVPVAA